MKYTGLNVVWMLYLLVVRTKKQKKIKMSTYVCWLPFVVRVWRIGLHLRLDVHCWAQVFLSNFECRENSFLSHVKVFMCFIAVSTVLYRLLTADGFYEEFLHGRKTLKGLPLPAQARPLLENTFSMRWCFMPGDSNSDHGGRLCAFNATSIFSSYIALWKLFAPDQLYGSTHEMDRICPNWNSARFSATSSSVFVTNIGLVGSYFRITVDASSTFCQAWVSALCRTHQ